MYHVILVDMQGFCGGIAGDRYDSRIICWGNDGLDHFLRRYWQGRSVYGLFETDNPLRNARLVQERIHFIGFRGLRGEDEQYRESLFGILYWNPNLFDNQEAKLALQLASRQLDERARRGSKGNP